ncbi:MAG: NnrS family protein [Hyphomonadaceae bacterium]
MTTTTAERYRAYRGLALFSMGFRPFFLLAAVWAALAVPLWVAAFAGWLPIEHFNRDWHAHEMVFGYLSGVIAGFLLTAVPNWTGRLPVTGAPLMGLVLLWCAGRAAMLIPGFAAAPIVDGAFLFVFAAVVGREIIAGSNVRNAPVLVLLTVLGSANVLSHLRSVDPDLALLGERIGIAVVATLVALIGGRIVPSFTRNWMAKRKLTPEPASPSRFDAVALSVGAIGLGIWAISPELYAAGLALTLAGALHFVRLARWRGWRTTVEPLVLILHLGYFWLALGLCLKGLAILAPSVVPAASGLHAITAGAFGVMTLSVMTRASLGHTGQPLAATPRISAIYVLVNLGALVRVAAPFLAEHYTLLVALSAVLWSGAFAWFAIVYAPLLLRPRQASAG